MRPIQRPVQIMFKLEKIAECFQKAGEEDIYTSVTAAIKIVNEILKHSNDMMTIGGIKDFTVSNFILGIK